MRKRRRTCKSIGIGNQGRRWVGSQRQVACMTVSLNEKIPNNVNLSDDRKLQRALEAWQPQFVDWWLEMGPEGYQNDDIYLRTAVSVEPGGWANFEYVKMPDYRWGIFMAPTSAPSIGFGDNLGKDVWQQCPGEHRKDLRRIIVTQADTEPASVEQQRLLGAMAPSLYDLRNLFQVNVEEGRHLWAMAYLLHRYFGRDGRDEAEELLIRRSGHEDSPRILGAFNQPIENFLDFFCFAMFADRDGKYQLASLAESAFSPLARTTQFMLTEEAHHLFVGEAGLARIVQRTCELMKESPSEDVKDLGGIPLDMMQRYFDRWFSVCLDLFGGDDSSNAAQYFASGLKGRFKESTSKDYTDHVALEGCYELEVPTADGGIGTQEVPKRRAMNRMLQDRYVEDCNRALRKWNGIIKKAGVDFELTLPSLRFNRGMGPFAGYTFNTNGDFVTGASKEELAVQYAPTDEDRDYLEQIMQPVREPGKYANWISPPKTGINRQPSDFEYVRFS